MTLVAHLGGRFGVARHLAKFASFGNVVAERFLTINSLIQVHGQHRGGSVMVVRCRDEYSVDLFADLVVHDAIIGEHLKFIRILLFPLQPFFDFCVGFFIGVDDRHQVFLARVYDPVQVAAQAAPAATDLHAIQPVAGSGGGQDVGAGKKAGGGKRTGSQGRALEE